MFSKRLDRIDKSLIWIGEKYLNDKWERTNNILIQINGSNKKNDTIGYLCVSDRVFVYTSNQ